MKGIPLSEKHGVNPCIPICFWCGKEKNEIALLGKLKGDIEAPRSAILDYIPCEECIAKFSQGVLIIEGTDCPESIQIMPISKDNHGNEIYPTGRYSVISLEGLSKILKDSDRFTDGSKMVVDEETYEYFFGKKD